MAGKLSISPERPVIRTYLEKEVSSWSNKGCLEASPREDNVREWNLLDMLDLFGPQDDGEERVSVREDDGAGRNLGITL